MYQVRDELRGETLEARYATQAEAQVAANICNRHDQEPYLGKWVVVKEYWPN